MPLTGTAKRKVLSCSPVWANCTSMVTFDSTVATASALGVATTTERDTLIQFARGENVTGELGKASTVMRPSVHGDVIHSNPLALSYGSDVIVYYGSNDGMLHAINGNRTTNYDTTYAPGDELWSFIPPEYFPNIDRLYDNEIKVSVSPPVGEARTGAPKPYGIDGPISAYREGAVTNIYATMRRGGRSVYAFNVSTPKTPVMRWRTGCANAPATNCTPGAEGLGQTWSTARPTKASGHAGGLQPVLVMGGGYDDCEDPDVHTCNDILQTPNPKGRKILVLDAATGDVLKSLPTDRGVVSDIKIVPDEAGLARYGYAADLGGNIYRITIGDAAPADWTITKIASLGCDTVLPCASNRKFMFTPSVIPELDGSVSLYLGSGDREKPLGSAFFPRTVEVTNYFFKVKDKPNDSGWLTAEFSTCGANVLCLASLRSAGSTNGTCGAGSVITGKGWVLGLRPTEQVVTLAATRFGVTTFSTHMPDVPTPGVCTGKLGKVHVYNIDIGTAAPVTGSTCSDEVKGGGLPPPPEKMDVCANDACTVVKSICIGCSTQSPIQSRENAPPSSTLGSNAKRRVYWYIQK
jgi:type IV pilus assembly protein PilY1